MDALNWIENALYEYKDNAMSASVSSKIDTNIKNVNKVRSKT
jgi:hypothetical protein